MSLNVPSKAAPPGASWLETALRDGVIPSGTFYGAVASTPKGRDRVIDVLEHAVRILTQQGLVNLTLRSVARESGITLANLQHYFPNHEDLVSGLLLYVADRYDGEYRVLVNRPFASQMTKLETFIRFHVDDCTRLETTSLFFEIWSMCQRNDRLARLMDSMYAWHRQQVERLIDAANPGLTQSELTTRAMLIVAQIEGLTVLYCHGRLEHPDPETFRKATIQRAIDIAMAQ